jgi:hypothetical protein
MKIVQLEDQINHENQSLSHHQINRKMNQLLYYWIRYHKNKKVNNKLMVKVKVDQNKINQFNNLDNYLELKQLVLTQNLLRKNSY